MRKKVILITGAAGEIGEALINALSKNEENHILSVDLRPLPEHMEGKSTHISRLDSRQNLIRSSCE